MVVCPMPERNNQAIGLSNSEFLHALATGFLVNQARQRYYATCVLAVAKLQRVCLVGHILGRSPGIYPSMTIPGWTIPGCTRVYYSGIYPSMI